MILEVSFLVAPHRIRIIVMAVLLVFLTFKIIIKMDSTRVGIVFVFQETNHSLLYIILY